MEAFDSEKVSILAIEIELNRINKLEFFLNEDVNKKMTIHNRMPFDSLFKWRSFSYLNVYHFPNANGSPNL